MVEVTVHVLQRSLDVLKRIMQPFENDDLETIEEAIHGNGPPNEELAKDNHDIVKRQSMRRLEDGVWLNDEVVNYYLKSILRKRDEMLCRVQNGRRRSHCYNSFFADFLLGKNIEDPHLKGTYQYSNVERWARKVPGGDIFGLKYLLIPKNQGNSHWQLVCVYIEKKTIAFYDSLHGNDWTLVRTVFTYLKDVWNSTHCDEEMDWSEWTVGYDSNNPKQENSEQNELPQLFLTSYHVSYLLC